MPTPSSEITDLYVLGGIQRPRFRDAQQDWLLFERAVIARVGLSSPSTELCFTYETPLAARASARSSVLFKSGARAGDRVYACTSTEILVLQLPGLVPVGHISMPFFNDLHHVVPSPHGTLLVAVTGLDLVAEVSLDGRLIAAWSALGSDPWQRFSPASDYRRIATLKPYRSHVNFCFWAQGELWATRGDLADAVCLAHPSRRISLGVSECVHDGLLHDGFLYFTSVDGKLIVVSAASLRLEQTYDLNALLSGRPPGYSWCRGVLPLDSHRVWVGFTRIRQTLWKEKLRWIKSMVSSISLPTRLCLFDLVRRECLCEVNLEEAGMHAVFNMLPATPVPAAAPAASGAAPVAR